MGYPFQYYFVGHAPTGSLDTAGGLMQTHMFWPALILDAIIWFGAAFGVACILIRSRKQMSSTA